MYSHSLLLACCLLAQISAPDVSPPDDSQVPPSPTFSARGSDGDVPTDPSNSEFQATEPSLSSPIPGSAPETTPPADPSGQVPDQPPTLPKAADRSLGGTELGLPSGLDEPRLGAGVRASANPANRPRETPREPESQGIEETPTATNLLAEAVLDRRSDVDAKSLLSLRRTLERSSDHLAAIRAYWRLVAAVASVRWHQSDAQFLADLPSPSTAAEEALLLAARARASAALADSRLQLLTVQGELAERLGAEVSSDFPAPADLPLVSAYRTRLNEIYPDGTAPSRLERINQLLPAQRSAIHAHAEAVQTSDQARQTLASDGGTAGTFIAMLAIQRDLQQHRRDFLQAIVEYNDQIAVYALSVTGGYASPDQLVTMLIGRDRNTASLSRSRVQPASATLPVNAAVAPFRRAVEPTPATLAPREADWKSLPNAPKLPSSADAPRLPTKSVLRTPAATSASRPVSR